MKSIYGRPRSRGWTRISYGLYARGEPDAAEKLRVLSLVLPARAAYTHLTAAWLRGWWLPGPLDLSHPVFVATRKGESFPQRRGVRVLRQAQWPSVQIVQGVRVVTAAEVMLAACRDLGLLDLVQLGDSALRLEHCALEDLIVLSASRRPGTVQLRRVIPLLDSRSESRWESLMRVLYRAADIEVEPQKSIYDARGRFVARADLWVVGTRRILEWDDADHREQETHRKNPRRDRALADLGLERCGYTAADLIHGGGDIIASADRLLSRPWDAERLRRWNALIDESLLGTGREPRVQSRRTSVG